MRRIDLDVSERGVAILTLVGEHEYYSVPALEDELDRAFAAGLSVVVDLTHAEFLDSGVVSALLRAKQHAEDHGLKFALVLDESTGAAVRQLFEITRLESVFALAPSRGEAVAAVGGPR